MSEHYTMNTEEVSVYCSKCGRVTVHKVNCGRLAQCLEHQVPIKVKRPRPEQFKLFDGDK